MPSWVKILRTTPDVEEELYSRAGKTRASAIYCFLKWEGLGPNEGIKRSLLPFCFFPLCFFTVLSFELHTTLTASSIVVTLLSNTWPHLNRDKLFFLKSHCDAWDFLPPSFPPSVLPSLPPPFLLKHINGKVTQLDLLKSISCCGLLVRKGAI